MDIKVCTCVQCRHKKRSMKRNQKKIIKRLINKKRRVNSYKVYNHYYA